MAEHGAHDAHGEFTEHIVPLKVYVGVFVALLVGTALTTGVAYIDLGRWNTVVALAIAVIKMLFVVLFFMHVKYNPGLTRIIIVGAFFLAGDYDLLLDGRRTDPELGIQSGFLDGYNPSIRFTIFVLNGYHLSRTHLLKAFFRSRGTN